MAVRRSLERHREEEATQGGMTRHRGRTEEVNELSLPSVCVIAGTQTPMNILALNVHASLLDLPYFLYSFPLCWLRLMFAYTHCSLVGLISSSPFPSGYEWLLFKYVTFPLKLLVIGGS